jgi:hypothetical protein
MNKAKVESALRIIRENLALAQKPVVWSSFGKDSIVLIDLISKINKDIPILFQKEFACPEKYTHANRVIEKYGLNVYSFPPMNTAVQYHTYKDGSFEWEIQNYYSYKGRNFTIPTGIVDNPKSDLCCLERIYRKPFAIVDYMWDMQFIGHKDCDTDAFYETCKLDDYVYKKDNLPTCIFPLKDWSDKDIWDYIDENNLDYNEKRYVRKGENWRGQFKDTKYNPDYFECCLECMKFTNKGKEVFCPKLNKKIMSIADKIRYDNAPEVEYFNNEGK